MVQVQNIKKFNEDFIKSIRFSVQTQHISVQFNFKHAIQICSTWQKKNWFFTNSSRFGTELNMYVYMPNCKEVPNL